MEKKDVHHRDYTKSDMKKPMKEIEQAVYPSFDLATKTNFEPNLCLLCKMPIGLAQAPFF